VDLDPARLPGQRGQHAACCSALSRLVGQPLERAQALVHGLAVVQVAIQALVVSMSKK